MTLIQLFISFLQVGLLSIGGGYAAIPLIQNEVVYKHAWISLQEFSNLVIIAEMTPGPIAINSATFVGIKIAGISGAIIASLGCILPSFIIISILAYIYYKYKNIDSFKTVLKTVRPAIISMILIAGITIFKQAIFNGASVNFFLLLIFIIAFIFLRKTKLNPILIMFMCGLLTICINPLIK